LLISFGQALCACARDLGDLSQRRVNNLDGFIPSLAVNPGGSPARMFVARLAQCSSLCRTGGFIEGRLNAAQHQVVPQRARHLLAALIVKEQRRRRPVEVLLPATPLPGVDQLDAVELVEHLDVVVEEADVEIDLLADFGGTDDPSLNSASACSRKGCPTASMIRGSMNRFSSPLSMTSFMLRPAMSLPPV
jgi:hypothetical protein